MKFRTEIQLSPRQPQIDYQTEVVTAGSCFADRIGQRLQQAKFSTTVNPLGIAYNPVSLSRQLRAVMGNYSLAESMHHPELGFWHSFDLHSSFNHQDKSVFEKQLEKPLSHAKNQLSKARVLMLTFGTAWVYRKKETGNIVSNCHKYPSEYFSRDLLTLNGLMEEMFLLIRHLQAFNANLEILLTVSPIRHIKDGLEKNTISKSTLRLLCQHLRQSFDHIHYFPAYEIMLDDLRDYRFYKDDLIHPTSFAEDYIWEHFIQTHLTQESRQLLLRWQQLQKEITHRPLRPDSMQYRQFLEKLLNKLIDIHEHLNCKEEITLVQQRLTSAASM